MLAVSLHSEAGLRIRRIARSSRSRFRTFPPAVNDTFTGVGCVDFSLKLNRQVLAEEEAAVSRGLAGVRSPR